MGRHNKAKKEAKAKAREEREAKVTEEKKLLKTSNNVAVVQFSNPAAEGSATNSASCASSSHTAEVQENETPNGSHLRNETVKESGRGNEVMKAEEDPKGWPQLGKGGDVRKSGEASSSSVYLQPSTLENRQKPRVEGSNAVDNKFYSGGESAQSHSSGWGTVGNGRGARGGNGDQAGYSTQPRSGGRGDSRTGGYGRGGARGGYAGDSITAGNGRGGVGGGYGHQATASQVDDFTRIESLGRLLSSVLRHRADELRLKVRSDGYVLVKDLLNLRLKTYAGLPLNSYTVDDIKEVVRTDNKQRFGLREESGQLLIRANQGHSMQIIKSEDLLTPVKSPEEVSVCVHGTYFEYMGAIQKEGLKRMNRRHIHFATGLLKEKGVISGMRSSCEVLIHLDVQKYLKDGMKLYRSENGVILAEGKNGVIPPNYFANIETIRR